MPRALTQHCWASQEARLQDRMKEQLDGFIAETVKQTVEALLPETIAELESAKREMIEVQ